MTDAEYERQLALVGKLRQRATPRNERAAARVRGFGEGITGSEELSGSPLDGDQYREDAEAGRNTGKWLSLGSDVPGVGTALGAGAKGLAATKAMLIASTLRDPVTKKAAQMIQEGRNVNDIWRETGRMQVPTGHVRDSNNPGRWMYERSYAKEIPDEDSFIKPEWLEGNSKLKPTVGLAYLKDVLHHPELYKEAPYLQNVRVFSDPKYGGAGSFSQAQNRITVNPDILDADNMHPRDVLLHEMQHAEQAKQARQGWPAGMNAQRVHVDEPVQESMRMLNAREQTHPTNTTRTKAYKNITDQLRDPYQLYLNELGEQQARSTELRSWLPRELLAKESPLTLGYDNIDAGYKGQHFYDFLDFASDKTAKRLREAKSFKDLTEADIMWLLENDLGHPVFNNTVTKTLRK